MDVVAGKHIKLGMLPGRCWMCGRQRGKRFAPSIVQLAKTEPLMERGFTVSGDGVNKPCNLIVKIGTRFEEMLEAAGGFKDGEGAGEDPVRRSDDGICNAVAVSSSE